VLFAAIRGKGAETLKRKIEQASGTAFCVCVWVFVCGCGRTLLECRLSSLTSVALLYLCRPSPSKSSLTYLSGSLSRFVRRSVTLTDEKENNCVG
jgi:hypothetical protein